MIFHRWGPGRGGTDFFIVALNFSDGAQQVDVPFPRNGLWTDLLAYPPQLVNVESFAAKLCIPSHYGCVLHLAA
jgi:hypothetical protein